MSIPSNAAAQPSPIDGAAFTEIACGDHAAERRLLSVFRAANDNDFAALDAALHTRDQAAVTRAAHRLLGAAKLAGATVLVDLCCVIVQAAKAGEWDALAANRDALDRELARVNRYLDARLSAQPDVQGDAGR